VPRPPSSEPHAAGAQAAEGLPAATAGRRLRQRRRGRHQKACPHQQEPHGALQRDPSTCGGRGSHVVTVDVPLHTHRNMKVHLEPKMVLQSDVIEEPFLVPQRTFQTKVL